MDKFNQKPNNMHMSWILCIWKFHIRATLDLSEELIEEAMEVTHCKTKTSVIISALENSIRKSKLQELKEYTRKVDLDTDLNSLKKR